MTHIWSCKKNGNKNSIIIHMDLFLLFWLIWIHMNRKGACFVTTLVLKTEMLNFPVCGSFHMSIITYFEKLYLYPSCGIQTNSNEWNKFSQKYIKLAMTTVLSFLYYLSSEEQNNFSKKVPPVGIKLGTLGLCDLLCVQSHCGIFNITFVGAPIDFWTSMI